MNLKQDDMRALHLGSELGFALHNKSPDLFHETRQSICEPLDYFEFEIEIPTSYIQFSEASERIVEDITLAFMARRAVLGGPVYSLPLFLLSATLYHTISGIALSVDVDGDRSVIQRCVEDMGLDDDLLDILYEQAAAIKSFEKDGNQNVRIEDILNASRTFISYVLNALFKKGALADDSIKPTGDLEKLRKMWGSVAYLLIRDGYVDHVAHTLRNQLPPNRANFLTIQNPVSFARTWLRWDGSGQPKNEEEKHLWSVFEKSEHPGKNLNKIRLRQYNDSPHCIIFVHGIRTTGRWLNPVKSQLEGIPGLTVRIAGFPWLDVVRFWIPWMRNRPVATLESRIVDIIREVRESNPNGAISVIAHSFGTYALAKIIERNNGLILHRIVLCGAIIPVDFPWHNYADQITGGVVNEVGTNDIWPAIAESATWGFGSSGIQGFRHPRVTDRFFCMGHGGFFDPAFVRQNWMPWFQSGSITEPSPNDLGPSYWLMFLSKTPVRWLITAVLVLGIAGAALKTVG